MSTLTQLPNTEDPYKRAAQLEEEMQGLEQQERAELSPPMAYATEIIDELKQIFSQKTDEEVPSYLLEGSNLQEIHDEIAFFIMREGVEKMILDPEEEKKLFEMKRTLMRKIDEYDITQAEKAEMPEPPEEEKKGFMESMRKSWSKFTEGLTQNRLVQTPAELIAWFSSTREAKLARNHKVAERLAGSWHFLKGKAKSVYYRTKLGIPAVVVASFETGVSGFLNFFSKEKFKQSWSEAFRGNLYGEANSGRSDLYNHIDLLDEEVEEAKVLAKESAERYMQLKKDKIVTMINKELAEEYPEEYENFKETKDFSFFERQFAEREEELYQEKYEFFNKTHQLDLKRERLATNGETASYAFGVEHMKTCFSEARTAASEQEFYEKKASEHFSEAWRMFMHGPKTPDQIKAEKKEKQQEEINAKEEAQAKTDETEIRIAKIKGVLEIYYDQDREPSKEELEFLADMSREEYEKYSKEVISNNEYKNIIEGLQSKNERLEELRVHMQRNFHELAKKLRDEGIIDKKLVKPLFVSGLNFIRSSLNTAQALVQQTIAPVTAFWTYSTNHSDKQAFLEYCSEIVTQFELGGQVHELAKRQWIEAVGNAGEAVDTISSGTKSSWNSLKDAWTYVVAKFDSEEKKNNPRRS